MELIVIQKLEFKLSTPTSLDFLKTVSNQQLMCQLTLVLLFSSPSSMSWVWPRVCSHCPTDSLLTITSVIWPFVWRRLSATIAS